jgi:hypothetical protein
MGKGKKNRETVRDEDKVRRRESERRRVNKGLW